MSASGSLTIGNLLLESGAMLEDVEIAYTAFGKLSPDGDNAVLVTHGYTSGPAMLESGPLTAEGAWDAMVKPGRALDPADKFVVCCNMLGSSYGSTGPKSIRPRTGKPWGPQFPKISLKDIVATQRQAMRQLGVRRLRAVVGPSFGGLQALQWAHDHPEMVDAIGVIVSGVAAPNGFSADKQRASLAQFPAWNGGEYYESDGMQSALVGVRTRTLKTYGLERLYLDKGFTQLECDEKLLAASKAWASVFDANSLVVLAEAAEAFDARPWLSTIRARVLFMVGSTDPLFPPDPRIPELFSEAGISDFRYRVIDSPYGHLASGIEWRKVDPELHWLLRQDT